MSVPLWGHVYDLILPGARADAVVVLSEDDWNARTRDIIIVPAFRDQIADRSTVRVAISDQLVADCTRVQNLPQENLGQHRGLCPGEALTRVRLGVRVYLDLDRLLEMNPRAPLKPRAEWWPRQGQVRYADVPGLPGEKMFCIVSDDDWNSRPTTVYSAAVRLTSKRRDWRSPWEVEVPGGCVVAGHLHFLLHDKINPRPPGGTRPTELSPEELGEIAARLATLLRLGRIN